MIPTQRRRVYSLSTREKSVSLLNQLESTGTVLYNNNEYTTVAELAKSLNVPRQTLLGWKGKQWDRKSLKDRLSNRGRKGTLTQEEQSQIRDWIVNRCESFEVTGWKEIAMEVKNRFDWEPQQSWVSKFCKKWGIASHATQKRPTKRIRDTIDKEIRTFVDEVNDETKKIVEGKLRLARCWVIDEAGLHDDSVVEQSYSPIGTSPSVLSSNSSGRDTIIAGASNDGIKLPLHYIRHRPKKYGTRIDSLTGEKFRVITDRGCLGVGIREWSSYIRDIFWTKARQELGPRVQPQSGDFLFIDRLGAHFHPETLEFLHEKGITVRFFPTGAAPQISLCDNALFRDYKREFGKKLNALPDFPHFSPAEKKEVANAVWNEFPSSRIEGYWRKCGFDK